MEFNKITEADRQGKGNVGQPDTPALSTADMQQLMDSLPNLAIDKFNAFIDAINAAMQNSVSSASTNDQIPTAKAVWDIFDTLDSDIISAVNAWLVAHPEATTTVQDGSLTIDKFAESVKSEIQSIGDEELTTDAQTLKGAVNELKVDIELLSNYVTPEMFGAKGDGIADDAVAIQRAMNNGKNVKFDGQKVYKIATDIYVADKDLLIDFDNAHLIMGATIHFKSTPVAIGDITYSANTDNITTNVSCENGIFNIVDDSETVRGIPLGFSSVIKDKILDTKFNYTVTGQAKYYPHMSVNIKNIGDISNADSSRRMAFDFLGCTVNISNVFAKDYTQLILFYFSCSHVTVRDVSINSSLRPETDNYHYGFAFNACSDWLLERVIGKADWHIATTVNGNKGQSLNGIIRNCVFKWYTHSMYSYLEHNGTAFGTKFFNSVLDGFICNGASLYKCVIQLCGMITYVDDAKYKQDLIYDECLLYKNGTQIMSNVYLADASTNGTFGNVIFKNCKFNYSSSSYFNTCPNNTEFDIVGGNLIIDNCDVNGLSSVLAITDATNRCIYSKVIVKNCNINTYLNSLSDLKCDLEIDNCRFFTNDGTTKELLYCKTNNIYVYNCIFELSAIIKARGTGSGALFMFYSKFDKNITIPSSGSAYPYTCVYCIHKDNTPIANVVV